MTTHSNIKQLVSQIQHDGEYSFIVRWLLNPGQEPRQNVKVSVADRVIAELSECPNDERRNVLPLAMMPRLLNAHTHLEFSLLTQPCEPAEPFTDWIRSVMRSRSESDDRQAALDLGKRETVQSGVAAIGEISTSDDIPFVDSPELRAVQFREIIGLEPSSIDERIQIARNHLDQSACMQGLSPHAPYSVHRDLFHSLVELAARRDAPLAMHLAETRDEVELLETGTGRFVSFLSELGLWRDDLFKSETTTFDFLQAMAVLPHAMAVHGNYLNDQELSFLCEHPNVALAYCPRTHDYFGHSQHPWRQLVKDGATITIGTDSRASNPDLSVWKELQFLSRQSQTLPWADLLKLATINAARALALSDVQTTIASGAGFDALFVGCDARTDSQLSGALSSPECQPVLVVADGNVCSVESRI